MIAYFKTKEEKNMTAVYLLLGYVGLDVLGFNYLCLIPLALAFFMTVMQDKALSKTQHQYFLMTLVGVTVFEFVTLSWLWGLDMIAFSVMYMSENSKNLTKVKAVKKEAVKVGDKIKNKVFNFNLNKND